jgi:hypothetical protein
MDEKLERFDPQWQDLERFIRKEALETGVHLDSDASYYFVDHAAKVINAAPPAAGIAEQVDLAKTSFSGVVFGMALGMSDAGIPQQETIHVAHLQAMRSKGWFCGFRPWC